MILKGCSATIWNMDYQGARQEVRKHAGNLLSEPRRNGMVAWTRVSSGDEEAPDLGIYWIEI